LILARGPLNQYVIGLAKALWARGFEIDGPVAQFDDSGYVVFSILGLASEPSGEVTMKLEETWRPMPERHWARDEYTYDLVDEPMARRRAFHLHDRAPAQAHLHTHAHEHCEDVLGRPACGHYLGREIPDGYIGIDLLMAAWLEPGTFGCSSLVCLDPDQR